LKKTKGPKKINIEENNLGINFKKSEEIKNYFAKSSYPWKNDIVTGPFVDDVFIIYVNSQRLQNVIELESLKIINNIEKKLGFSINSLLVQFQNNQQ
jgi:hypothetical protein|tara:strand:+ start:432 stop:722 length:291 start_codon:yes stop_codon:yes gene_type:complete